MGEKKDYRSNNQKNRTKILKIVGVIVLIILFLYVAIDSLKDNTSATNESSQADVATYKNVSEYETLEDLLNKYGCTYISENDTTNFLTVYLKFNIDLYTDGTSNETFFTNLIKSIAVYENYKSFELIDEERDIDIVVTCEDEMIVEIEINGDNNYFLNEDSKINSQLEKVSTTGFNIESSELQTLIANNWNPTGLSLGSKESTCNDYEIYFDEGFEYKVVGRTVYNIIFTEKYESKIVNGLNANSTVEEIEAALGEAVYEYNSNIYGYLGESVYIFFDLQNSEVSIYPVQTMTEEEENEFIELIKTMNENSDVKQFSMDLTSLWTDYDIYDYDSNYVDLQYTLKGIELTISSSSLKNGIYIYQNYSGTISNISSLDNVYIQEEDCVFEEEKNRVTDELLNRSDMDYEDEREISSMFTIKFANTSLSKIQIFSKDKNYVDSELNVGGSISSYNWYNDYLVIYSIDDDGLYVYDCVSMQSSKICDIEGEITINLAGDGSITYNDTEVLEIEIN